MDAATSVGAALRQWRHRRHLSQLGLAVEAEISARHLSFLETGRSVPSREMVLRLAEHLDVPLRVRNRLLVAAGYAPVFPERPLTDPALEPARRAVELVLQGHEPYPALAIDRRWELLSANKTALSMMTGIDPELAKPPVNVLRVSMHPSGLAPRIVNLAEWRSHILSRLRRQIDVTADAALEQLLEEIKSYPVHTADSEVLRKPGGQLPLKPHRATGPADYGGVVIPLRMKTPEGILSFFSTTTVFGTPVDITLSEIMLESFFPADPATAAALHRVTR